MVLAIIMVVINAIVGLSIVGLAVHTKQQDRADVVMSLIKDITDDVKE